MRETEADRETAIMIVDAAETAPREAAEKRQTWERREATPEATKVGGEAEAATMIAVTHAATEMGTTTGADGRAPGPDRGPHTAITALVMSVIAGTDATAPTDTLASMDEAEMMTAGIPSVRPHPSLLKMNGTAALCLSSS